jgi:hypothetical protein
VTPPELISANKHSDDKKLINKNPSEKNGKKDANSKFLS